MIESVLIRNHASLRVKITVKALVSAGIVVLAVLLPQLVHLAAGASGGVAWLPMYLPVLLGGCLLGWQWGLGVGILSPVISFAVTALAGQSHACRRPSSVHDGGTRRLCRRLGTVLG